jgi:signal transduction histidine kinase
LRKLIRNIIARAGQDSDVWPVALLSVAVLVPALCLVWFMDAAMRNERLAARQKLADVYRAQLSSTQARLDRLWRENAVELQKLSHISPAPAAFAKCVESGLVDSVVLFDERGNVTYPNTPMAEAGPEELDARWQNAGELEYLRKDFLSAAQRYGALAAESTNVNLAARAFQAQARCFVRGGQKEAAIRVVNEVLNDKRFDHAVDAQGRLIAANAELLALELLADPALFQSTLGRLKGRLTDYESTTMAAPQRRFLMKEVRRISPKTEFATLPAEELAAQAEEQRFGLTGDAALHRAPSGDLWLYATPNRRVLAIIRSGTLLNRLRTVLTPEGFPSDVEVKLFSPGAEGEAAFVSVPAGQNFPGWQLAISFKNQETFDAPARKRMVIYLWTGVLVIAAMGILAVLAVRLVRRQAALARLKNDLAATVSHELKTPLASMRVLVDTLLNAEKLDEQTAREYLQLIARENERLSRLIHNFLTFSRMERRKHTFHFERTPVRKTVMAAVDAVRDRFGATDACVEVQFEPDLPDVVADADALVTALINLLENAEKFSDRSEPIILRAYTQNEEVIFSVRDRGFGIAPQEIKRIFRPFYQSDQRLSRKGSGCGLGLSIVQFIVAAHGGRISIQSEPGRGSTFEISIPAAAENKLTEHVA